MDAPEKNTPRNFFLDRFRTFADVFAYNKAYIPQGKPFLQAEDRELTYGQLDDLTARLCRFFADQGLKRCERAVILSHDDLAVAALFMACLRYGLTAVILNPAGGEDEQRNLIAAARPRGLFMDRDFLDKLGLNGQNFITLPITPYADHRPPTFLKRMRGAQAEDNSFPQLVYKSEPPDDEAPVPLDTTAYILFTSGTTSRPKGVEITHGNLLAQMKTFIRQYDYDVRSRLLDILPLHHTDGLTQGPVVAFVRGCSVFRPLRFSIDKIPMLLDSLYRFSITHFIAVPAMLQLIDAMGEEARDAFLNDHFRFVISTAGYLDPNLWERFEKRFDLMVVNVYGLTETVCESLYCGPSPETRKLGTIGKPVDTECRIVNDDGLDVRLGETGELWLRGPHIMKGYFEMPEETAAVLTSDGWFKTGDLCRMDEEGFYYIVGRKKNIIIVGGINIYPDDVANILRSLPGVLDAAVWGEEDPVWGETVVAAVLPEAGAKPDPHVLGEGFLQHAAVEMLPRRIHIVDEFPRGPAGKVIVRDLRSKIDAMKSAAPKEGEGGNIVETVITIAADAFKCQPETLNLESTAETTRGWNSLAHIEFLLNLEKRFGIKVEPRDIMGVRSLSDALNIVQAKISRAA